MAIPFPDISPIALSIGPLDIRWYALAYLSGFLLGWRYALHLAGLDAGKDGAVSKLAVDDFLPWAIAGVILGGRLGYALFYQADLYLREPLEILKLWNGGMSFHGGALGVIAAMILYARRRGFSLLRLTDIVCCAVPIGLFFGRIANFINGELFGRPTDAAWGVVFPRGGDMPRHPSQFYEAGLEGLALFALLALLARREDIRDRPGILSGVFLIGYAVSRMIVECFREPDAQIGFLMGAATMGQVLSVPMMLGGCGLVFYAWTSRAVKAP